MMTPPSKQPVLITGGAGFIGSNLADRLAGMGKRVLVLDSLARPGVERNAAWLERRHGEAVSFLTEDIRNARAVELAVGDACAVFHLAAQVAVTRSLVSPREDFTVNLDGTVNVLEAVRLSGRRVPLVFASTNKVYGDLSDIALSLQEGNYQPTDELLRRRGIGEDRPLDFHTPYGCSKGAADQYVLDYARSFGLPTAVLRMSCIYGPRQLGTEDQGWVAHFAIRALQGEPITIYGDGRQVRDVLHVDDAVDAYLNTLKSLDRSPDLAGRAFNLGGGPANALSLLQLVERLEAIAGRRVDVHFEEWRAGDQRYFVADSRRARAELGLAAPLSWRKGLKRLVDWLVAEKSGAAAPVRQRAEA